MAGDGSTTMLSNLASYLGYSSAPAERTPPAGITAEVRVRDEEDDWVLVDREEDDPAATRVTLAITASKRSCPLQESWYLTPPPSFTSEGPVHMETSPLENMLIEHPSMSVYERSRSGAAGASADSGEEEARPPSPAPRVPRKDKLGKVPRNKIAAKYPKKDAAERVAEAKEPKMKNFVKSPRAKPQQRVPNVSRTEPFDRVLISDSESGAKNEFQVVPTRKLYSEVLASKPATTTTTTTAAASASAAAPAPATAPTEKEELPPPAAEAKEPEVPETATPPTEEEAEPAAAAATDKETSMSVEVEEGEEEEAISEERTDPERRRAIQTISDHQQRQNFLNRSAQKVEQRKTCDLMKRNPLIRTNKAREINFRNKRQRRADMMQRHSGANNNRKC